MSVFKKIVDQVTKKIVTEFLRMKVFLLSHPLHDVKNIVGNLNGQSKSFRF